MAAIHHPDNRRREAWDNEAERAVTQATAAAAANRNAERRQNMAMAEEVGPPSLSLSFYYFLFQSQGSFLFYSHVITHNGTPVYINSGVSYFFLYNRVKDFQRN